MNSRTLVIINIILLLLFVAWFLSSRKRDQNVTKLNLREGFNDSPPPSSSARGVQAPEASGTLPKERTQTSAADSEVASTAGRLKELNVIFNYNGHSFDAYEILGLPAGSSIVEVTKKYQKEVMAADSHQHPFLEAAYKAILNSPRR